ncbi:hypothetical protein ACQP1G_15920 [Nocardia sp. CA-107356]|uniref:hypothetical protein n=1 Tax=Nocardia sp. CA-107356 TaxID=3239972 RepID=UPI003D91F85F
MVAVSGLGRVGQQHRITETLPIETMCPPIGAGIIGGSHPLAHRRGARRQVSRSRGSGRKRDIDLLASTAFAGSSTVPL